MTDKRKATCLGGLALVVLFGGCLIALFSPRLQVAIVRPLSRVRSVHPASPRPLPRRRPRLRAEELQRLGERGARSAEDRPRCRFGRSAVRRPHDQLDPRRCFLRIGATRATRLPATGRRHSLTDPRRSPHRVDRGTTVSSAIPSSDLPDFFPLRSSRSFHERRTESEVLCGPGTGRARRGLHRRPGDSPDASAFRRGRLRGVRCLRKAGDDALACRREGLRPSAPLSRKEGAPGRSSSPRRSSSRRSPALCWRSRRSSTCRRRTCSIKGKVYLEVDELVRPPSRSSASSTMRGVYGFGPRTWRPASTSAASSLPGDRPFVTVAMKMAARARRSLALTTGGYGLFYLRGSRGWQSRRHGYGYASYRIAGPETRMKSAAGTRPPDTRNRRHGRSAVGLRAAAPLGQGSEPHRGLVQRRELDRLFQPRLHRWLRNWTVYAAYTRKNGSSKGNGGLVELGFVLRRNHARPHLYRGNDRPLLAVGRLHAPLRQGLRRSRWDGKTFSVSS